MVGGVLCIWLEELYEIAMALLDFVVRASPTKELNTKYYVL